jgi:cytoplasmic iron level regulating protein YaaA (DUF328/UPF0246 family)
MRIVLPPSETKQPGGEEAVLDWSTLALPELTATRQGIATDLEVLCGDIDAAKKALGLGAKGDEWVAANQKLLTSPVMPALQRYTGVLFDALEADSLEPAARTRADETVWLFSALFGPIRAGDVIPRYRLSWDSKLPGDSVKARWQSHADEIWSGEFTIDLRSEGYRTLAPLPNGAGVFVRVVTDLDQAAAAGHANKASKGRLVRQMVESGQAVDSASECVDLVADLGWEVAISPDSPEEILLVAS